MTVNERLNKHYGKIGKRLLIKIINACEDLLNYYTYKNEYSDRDFLFYHCPFCEIDGIHCQGVEIDNKIVYLSCPWYVFTGMDCSSWSEENSPMSKGFVNLCRLLRDEEWIKIRVPMLKRWIRHLKTFEESRNKKQ